ncbi:MAG: DNA replication/repair protein RecF [Lachnospiraceae bacterium]|nr:DNA replication/repair protein RecF [Lachnospiraceae bacterium]
MYIKKLELTDFRNYEKLNVEFNKNVNLLLGNNAQGKTNLLEAVYITSMGRSFRTNKDSDLVRFGQPMAKVKIEAVKEAYDTFIEINIKKDAKKSIKKDGINVKKSSELLENILIVIFSPEDLKIVKDEPEKRRKFIDRELCQIQPLYYDSLSNYKKTLVQRNIYLKEENPDSSILDLWDTQLTKYGSRIIYLREKFIKKISDFSGKIHSSITNGKESLFLEYNPNISYMESLNELEGYFYDEIKKSFNNDIRQRTTTRGPHKDDISFYVNGINMRNFGSQGQQRTCALSLKLAELNLIKEETDEDAVLLLDDVMSELDAARQEYLIKTLQNNQIFVTTTDIDQKIMDSFPDSKIIYIEKGKLRENETC